MRIKKTSATTPIQAQVVNTYNESQTNSYSCNYINSPDKTIIANDFVCKNIFNTNTIINGWIDGTTMRVNSTNGNRMAFIPCQPNTTYTISRSVVTSSFRVSDYTTVPSVTSSNVDYTVPTATKNDSGTEITYTTSATAKYLIVHYANVGTDSAATIANSLATIQVELGNTKTTFTPIEQPIKGTLNGVKENTIFYANDFKCKNLFGNYVTINNAFINASTNSIGSNNNTKCVYIPIEANTTYTVSKTKGNRFAIGFASETPAINTALTGIVDDQTAKSLTSTSNSNSQYLVIYCYNSSVDTDTFENIMATIQVEVGSEATPYTPYKNFDNTTIIYNLGDYIASGLTIDSSSLVSNDGIAILDFNVSKSTEYSTNTNITICTLPEALIPKTTIVGSCIFHSAGSNISAGYIVINTNGVVNVRTSASNENSCMGNITYSLI